MIYLGHAHKYKEKLALHKALLFLGDLFITNKDEETATNLYLVALEGFTCMDVHHGRAQCMLHLGDHAKKQGNVSEAIDFWKAAQPLFEKSSQTKGVAQIDSRLLVVEQAHQNTLLELTSLHTSVELMNKGASEE